MKNDLDLAYLYYVGNLSKDKGRIMRLWTDLLFKGEEFKIVNVMKLGNIFYEFDSQCNDIKILHRGGIF